MLFWTIGATVVGKPTTLTMISAPSLHPKYFFRAAIITRLAELPLLTMRLSAKPNLRENSRSNLATLGPDGSQPPCFRQSMAASISSPLKNGPE